MAVEILRDSWGIPHVRGDTVLDVAYGQGRADAEDRAWQLTYDGWRAEGRLAEHVGPAGLDWDVFARRAAVAETARRCFDRLEPENRDFVRAYVAGVNAGLAATEVRAPELDELGLTTSPWPDWMPLGVFIVQHILFSTFPTKLWRARLVDVLGVDAVEVLRLDGPGPARPIVGDADVEPVPVDRAALLEVVDRLGPDWLHAPEGYGLHGLGGGPMLSGSNSYAVGGGRTTSGMPIVAGDPHRLHDLPNVYHQVHLACPEFDVAGLAFVGVPGVPHFAHAGAVAWGITNAMADYQDLYVERLARRGNRVVSAVGDAWRPVEVTTQTVLVRDADPLVLETLRTGHGPVVLPLTDGLAVSLRTPALVDVDLGFDALLPLLRARSAADVSTAFARWVEPVNNLVAADRSGTVLYRTAGRLPDRPAVNRWLPVPGWEPAYDWVGTVPDAELPRRTVAPGEQVFTANQRISADSDRVGVEYAHPARAGRIEELLAGRSGLTVEDLAAVHADVHLPTAAVLQRALAGVGDLDPASREVVDLVVGWDGQMDADSETAGLYAALRSGLVDRIVADPVFADLVEHTVVPGFWDRWMSVAVRVHAGLKGLLEPGGEPDLDARPLGLDIRAALRAAISDVAARRSAGTVQAWGSGHVYAPLHALVKLGAVQPGSTLARDLDIGAVPLAGDSECVQANHSVPGLTDRSPMGPVARYVWDLAHRDASRWVVPMGASGVPGDAHVADQLDVWSRGGSVPLVTDWDRLTAEAVSRTVC